MHKDYDDCFASVERSLASTRKIFDRALSSTVDYEVQRLIARLPLLKRKDKILLPDQNGTDEFIHALSPLYREKISWSQCERFLFYFVSRLYSLFGKKLLCSFSIEDRSFTGMVYKNSKGTFIVIRAKNLAVALHAIRTIRNLIYTVDMQTI